MTYTHTYAILEVSPACYREIREKLDAAGYKEAFHEASEHGEVIDMHGIALASLPEKPRGFRNVPRNYGPGNA